VEPYKTWEQVAGYFDGDGTISISDISNQPYKLGISLIFTDASIEQITMLREFFVSRGYQTSRVLKSSTSAWMLAIGRYEVVISVLKSMLPHLYKKSIEAKAAIDYYEGRLTGNAFLEIFKVEVESGRRERHPHRVVVDVPYTYFEGTRLMNEGRRSRLRDALGKYRAKVSQEDYAEIRRKYLVEGKRLRDLVLEYPQYARETIRRVLGGGRGYVGIKGVGRVDTAEN
jgi:hypothetical protein